MSTCMPMPPSLSWLAHVNFPCFMLASVRRPSETGDGNPRPESLTDQDLLQFCNIANSTDCCEDFQDLLFPLRIASFMRTVSQVAANYRC